MYMYLLPTCFLPHSVCLSACLFAYLYSCLFLCLSVRLSECLSVCLSGSLAVCLSVCLFPPPLNRTLAHRVPDAQCKMLSRRYLPQQQQQLHQQQLNTIIVFPTRRRI